MTTRHTLFIAHLIAQRLEAHRWEVQILLDPPKSFDADMYIVICPQIFSQLPPGEKRIAFQMEQSTSPRWFTVEYLNILNESFAVLDYSLSNIEFLAKRGLRYPHIYYLPIGADPTYLPNLPQWKRPISVLFYGDEKSSPRRRHYLSELAKHFEVTICSEVFGIEMASAIKSADVIINIHYYPDALLETPRIQECLSLGAKVVSESAPDIDEYPDLLGCVYFFEQDNVDQMISAVRAALKAPRPNNLDDHRESNHRFNFMLDRFLISSGFLSKSHVDKIEIPKSMISPRVALAMPETIERWRILEENPFPSTVTFPGIRAKPGWMGCALSYSALAQAALKQDLEFITIIEDDAILPRDFEEKMAITIDFLQNRCSSWDIFSGLIADVHSDARILNVEDYRGMRFVTLDKMTSTVCNIYSQRALGILASWDSENEDAANNTIDRYLEGLSDFRVVVAFPFIAGHREEVTSTLWHFQNDTYTEMICKSHRTLEMKIWDFHRRTRRIRSQVPAIESACNESQCVRLN
jgi:hypothetical protein